MLRLVWAMVLIFFPVTTFPWFPGQGVRPLAAIPTIIILILAIIYTPERLRRVAGFEVKLILIFFTYCLIGSSFMSITTSNQMHDYYHNIEPLSDLFKGISSLVIGISFYISFRLCNLSVKELLFSEKLLLLSMFFSNTLAILQYLSVTILPQIRPGILFINHTFIDTSIDWTDRFHGFALEPSFFASQIATLVFPILMSRIFSGESLLKITFSRIAVPVEYLLFGYFMIGLTLSGSRGGIISVIIVFLIAYIFNFKLKFINFLYLIPTIPITLLIIIPLFSQNYLIKKTVNYISESKNLEQIIYGVSIGPRISTWTAGLITFSEFPALGVGLENSYRYYPQNVPEWQKDEPEIKSWLDKNSLEKPKPKNMIVRLLAETGIIGFFLYFAFFLAHYKFYETTTKRQKILVNVGLIAVLLNFLSLDSFSLPTEWLLLGFIASFDSKGFHESLNSYDKL